MRRKKKAIVKKRKPFRLLNSKKGSASMFICIILSAVMLVESVFYYASWIRNTEADLQRCMSLQAHHALASYNTKLFDYYGLYAIQPGYRSTDIIEECFPYAERTESSIIFLGNLETDSLYTGAVKYMKLRVPAMVLTEIIQNLKSATDTITQSGMQESLKVNQAAAPYLKEIFAGKNDLSGILASAANAIETLDVTGSLQHVTSLAKTYKELMEQKATLTIQGGISEAQFGDVTNPESFENVLSIVNGLVDVDLPDIAEAALLNEYMIACFDSQLSNAPSGSGILEKKGEVNFLYTPFSEVHGENQTDLEYIYTGSENHAKGLATASIYSMRAVISIAEILLDQQQMTQIQSIATAISAVIAILSFGMVSIDPAVFQYTIVLIKGLLEGANETKRLLDGEEFPLFDNPNMSDTVKKFLNMNYRDYFRFFLLLASKEDKLKRALKPLKRDCGSELPIKVQIKTNFMNKAFQIEKEYAMYDAQ